MGTDKAWLRLGKRYAIEWVIDALRPVAEELAIVANIEEYKQLGPPVYSDIIKDYGPLGGIHTALTNARNNGVLIVACDLPFVTTQLFEKLIAFGTDYEIVVPISQHGQTEQMCAQYSKECLPAIESLYKECIHTPKALFERCKTKRLEWSEIETLPNAMHFFDNLNTPEDYQRANVLSPAFRRLRHST